MPITVQDELDLLTVLHDGSLEQPRWATFLGRLRRRAGADYASLLLSGADAVVEQAVGPAGSTEPSRRPMVSLYRRAPTLFHALRPGRVYSLDEFLDPADAALQAYRRGYLADADLAHLRLMRVAEPGGANAWLIVARAKTDFSAATGSLLSALGPHLAISIRLSETIGRGRIVAQAATAALHRLGLGWLSIDRQGRVIDRDDRSGHLFPRHMPLQDAATGAASAAIVAILRRRDGRSHVVRLSSRPRIDLLMVPLAGEAASEPALMAVYVDAEDNHATSTREARAGALRDLFGLSASEARLADAISRGESIADAARRIGLTEQTARNYSKRIYAKTATSGQADLARLVLTGLAGLA